LVPEPGFVGVAPGSGSDHDRSRFRLPPGIDNRTTIFPMMRWYHIHASGLMGSPTVQAI